MFEWIARSPLALVGMLVASAATGAALYACAAPLVGGGDARIERVVKDTILENPEILPQAMENLRHREVGKSVASNRAAIVEPFGNAWEGNPNGDVTLVAYMDYACSYCRASLPALARLVENDPKLRIVYRELPILSAESRKAAEWSLAAALQGRFMLFHKALYAAGALSDATIEAAIDRAGLDRAQGVRDIASPRVSEEIARNMAVAGQLGMSGTPSWVIGNQMLSGALPYERMQAAVATARKGG